MNKSRVNRLEQKLRGKQTSVEIPIFLETDVENIFFTDKLLFELGINIEDYPKYYGDPLGITPEGRVVNKLAPFISHYSGEVYYPGCYLYLKEYENKPIILL